MEKMMLMRSLSRSILRRSQVCSSSAAASAAVNHNIRHLHFVSPSVPAYSPSQRSSIQGFKIRISVDLGLHRSYVWSVMLQMVNGYMHLADSKDA